MSDYDICLLVGGPHDGRKQRIARNMRRFTMPVRERVAVTPPMRDCPSMQLLYVEYNEYVFAGRRVFSSHGTAEAVIDDLISNYS